MWPLAAGTCSWYESSSAHLSEATLSRSVASRSASRKSCVAAFAASRAAASSSAARDAKAFSRSSSSSFSPTSAQPSSGSKFFRSSSSFWSFLAPSNSLSASAAVTSFSRMPSCARTSRSCSSCTLFSVSFRSRFRDSRLAACKKKR